MRGRAKTSWKRPQSISVAVGRLQEGLSPPTVLGEVQLRWAGAAGEAVAAHAEPVGERGGVITVRCDSSVWAAELTLLAPGICDRLNESLTPERQVRALRFTAAPR